MLPRVNDQEYQVTHRGSHFYISLRDKDRPNSEVLVAPVDDLGAAAVLLPHRRDVKVTNSPRCPHPPVTALSR